MNLAQLLRAVGRGEISFDDVKAQLEKATVTTRQPTRGDWGDVWARAEEVDDPDDIPEAVASATYAGNISKDQGAQLLAIYRQKVAPTS